MSHGLGMGQWDREGNTSAELPGFEFNPDPTLGKLIHLFMPRFHYMWPGALSDKGNCLPRRAALWPWGYTHQVHRTPPGTQRASISCYHHYFQKLAKRSSLHLLTTNGSDVYADPTEDWGGDLAQMLLKRFPDTFKY